MIDEDEPIKLDQRIINWEHEFPSTKDEKEMERQVNLYKALMLRRQQPNFALDPIFQAAYCYFYGFRGAYNKDEWLTKYFELMNNMQVGRKYDIKTEVMDKLGLKNGPSYASKLLHTVDSKLPIFDSMVKRAFKSKKTDLEFYKELALNLDKLLLKEEIEKAIGRFEDRYKTGNSIKSLDFIIWQIGKNDDKKENDDKKGKRRAR